MQNGSDCVESCAQLERVGVEVVHWCGSRVPLVLLLFGRLGTRSAGCQKAIAAHENTSRRHRFKGH